MRYHKLVIGLLSRKGRGSCARTTSSQLSESARTQDPLRRYGTGDEATDSFTMAVILIWKVLLSAFSDSSG